ncbi:hypothetical protein [Asticcacaulis sp. EMRT-3]|uniref:hypothetical protein n=1 Tax=Asticcacaulis sp. EMRT-3 TaxID=3040349 RepID=UPI0024AE9D06|nr:hypothetical protein [Asticcacaulis sp. EMRT-3]MDI7774409.1 hypothetical protein [Asticcacaulis sp. EMRT-3]
MSPLRRQFFVTLPLLALLPTLARADDKKDAAAPSVQLATVAVPITQNNRLVNYIFISVRVDLTMMANEGKFRDMEPYFRDAIVRVTSKTSFGLPGHDDQLDTARFKAAMMPAFADITGPGMVKSIDVLSQTPKFHH